MTKNDRPNRQQVVVAAAAAGFLMLISSAAYRVLAARLAAPVNTTPIPAAALERFPTQIGGWTGREVPMDEAIVRSTDTDAHINRRYSRRNGLESVSFYIACGVRSRDLMTHRPEVCYTGAGWTLIDKRSKKLPLSNGMELPCSIFQFSRGTLNTNKTVVLDYYIVDGQYCRDVSLLRSKAWRGSGTVDYVAQVQIVTFITAVLTTDSAERIVSDFAVESALPIAWLFENTKTNQNSDKSNTHDNHMLGRTDDG